MFSKQDWLNEHNGWKRARCYSMTRGAESTEIVCSGEHAVTLVKKSSLKLKEKNITSF